MVDGGQDQIEDSSSRAKAGVGALSVKNRVAVLEARGKHPDAVAVQQSRKVKPAAQVAGGISAAARQPKRLGRSTARVGQTDGTKTVQKSVKSNAAPTEIKDKPSAPVVYPLHYKRFVRRTSSGTPVSPETPLYRSQPDDKPMIHAPRPTKSIPILETPAETPKLKHASTFDHGASSTRPGQGSMGSRTKTRGITPPSFLHRSRNNCVRHGRKVQSARTKDMIKSRSGTYHPTGLTQRRQMEATSPWIVPHRTLTGPDASKSSAGSDACPDCVTELNIKRRELLNDSVATVKRPVDLSRTTLSSAFAAPTTSPKHQRVTSTEVSVITEESEDENLITVKDLGEGLDAIIVEHKGDLRRIVVNNRHGMPTVDTLQRLSRELAKVSDSIAFAGVNSRSLAPLVSKQDTKSAVVLDTKPRMRTPSVPELLDMIDRAADEIHLNTGKIAEHYVSRRDFAHENHHSLFSDSELDDVFGGDTWKDHGLVTRQSIDDDYRSLHEHLSTGSRKLSIPSVIKPPLVARHSPVTKPTSTSQTVSHAISTPSQPAPPATSNSSIRKLVKARPTLPASATSKPHVTPIQTPPPEHPSLHHAAEFSDLPKPLTLASQAPQVRPNEDSHHAFSFLDPFHRRQEQAESMLHPTSVPPSPK